MIKNNTTRFLCAFLICVLIAASGFFAFKHSNIPAFFWFVVVLVSLFLGTVYVYLSVEEMPFDYVWRIFLILLVISVVAHFLGEHIAPPFFYLTELGASIFILYETKRIKRLFPPKDPNRVHYEQAYDD